LKRVLIAEDQPHNMRLIQQIVEDMDEQIYIIKAATGQQVLHEINIKKADLILMDVALPDMDGVQLVKILKASQETADIPVIAVTAYAGYNEQQQLREVFDEYVSKPIDEDELVSIIKKWIGD